MKPVIFSEGDASGFEKTTQEEMESPIRHFEKELLAIRTGRASSALVADVKVECYGQMMSLRELASISTPDARLIVIQPWDKSNIGAIEKALQIADLGVNPVNDGVLIRLQLPMMSGERRAELIKQLGKRLEECRVGIRNVRKEAHNQLREAEKERLISEDWAIRLSELLQKITDKFIARAEDIAAKKENDLKI